MLKSLNQRLALLLLLPVALLLVSAGVAGFIYARNLLVDQWQQGAILKLERAAHHIDMRLGVPAMWMAVFHETVTGGGSAVTMNFIIEKIRQLDGVTRADLTWTVEPGGESRGRGAQMDDTHRMRHGTDDPFTVTGPRYDAEVGEETITLVSEILDEQGRLSGKLEVAMRFDHLMAVIEQFGWWQSQLACIVDASGRYLAHSAAMDKTRTQLGETHDPVEIAVLQKMQEQPHGTYLGSGHPPEMVSGFYRLEQAPWVLVMYAPGREILAPVVDFRFYFTIAGTICIVAILVLIRAVSGRMVGRIQNISMASETVAKGEYVDPLPITSVDEIGQLEKSFNAMVKGLKERDFIRDTFGRYIDKDIAVKLLERPEAARLGGEKREVAILMTDIRDFTSISESLTPETTIGILNGYFSRMIEVTGKHNGIIVDFYGDGLLVFFDPHDGPIEPAVDQALQCGMEMRETMETLRDELIARGQPAIETGIGIHAGEVVVGNIGSKTRAKYGIVGSAVNITARVCENAKGGEVVISTVIVRHAGKNLDIRNSFSTRLKGIQEEMTLFVL
jgi:adenylate cyclase